MIKEKNTYNRLVKLLLFSEGIWWSLVLIVYALVPLDRLGVKLLHGEMLGLWGVIPVLAVLSWIQWNWKAKIYKEYSGYGPTRMLWVKFEPAKAFLHCFGHGSACCRIKKSKRFKTDT